MSEPQKICDLFPIANATECVEGCVRLRSVGKTPMLQTLTTTLRFMAKRWLTLAEEFKALDAMLDSLANQHFRRIRERSASSRSPLRYWLLSRATLPNAGKAKPRWRHSAAQSVAGVVRHPLNRGGDRSANNALWTIAMFERAAINVPVRIWIVGQRKACRTR